MAPQSGDEITLDVLAGPSRTGSTASTPAGAGSPRRRSSVSPEPHDAIAIPLMGSPLAGRSRGGRLSGGITGLTSSGRRISAAGLPLNKLRSSKLRWALVLTLLVAVIMWQPKSPDEAASTRDDGDEYLAAAEQGDYGDDAPAVPFGRPPPVFDAHPPIPQRPPPMPPPPLADAALAEKPAVGIVAKPLAHPAPVAQQRPLPLDSHARAPIDVDVHASTTAPMRSPPNTRYLAYSPHSGYHNQRMSLENALTLAFMLGRTLLVPPVWLGHAIPYISFDKLQRRLEMANKDGLEHCIPFGDGTNEDPIPHECDDYWDWTAVDWSFLVDLSEAETIVPIRTRSSMSMSWLEDEIGLARPSGNDGERSDVYELKDQTMYQYRFYDSRDDLDPLEKWGNRIDIDQFRQETDEYKLVHVGSLFGTSRLRVTLDKNADARTVFRRSMVFHTQAVDDVVTRIRDQLGGLGKYHGLHLRVGDGVFMQEAKKNMADVWERLCIDKMKIDRGVCDELRVRGATEADEKERRDGKVGDDKWAALSKRANSRPQREGAYHHAPLPPLPTIRTLADSPLAPTLSCHGSLHTEERLLPFNAPLYVATDSKLPRSDPNLAIFFAAFPCSFTLSDFGTLPELETMNRLRAAGDKTPLAQFLYPQLDAQIAAWGRTLVGTPQSTYSRFASDVLHQVYQ